MFTHINPILGFLEEIKKLSNFPEITTSDTAIVRFGNYSPNNHKPIHSDKYDSRLFDSFSNSLRILIILNEPISLKNIHNDLKNKVFIQEFNTLDESFLSIQNYLAKNMNTVTPFSFSFPGSRIEKTNVHSLLNDYFAATIQHSKPDCQSRIAEINALT